MGACHASSLPDQQDCCLMCDRKRTHVRECECVCVCKHSLRVCMWRPEIDQVSSAALHFIFWGTVSHLTLERISSAMWACQLVPEVSSSRLECWHYTGHHSYLKSDPLWVKWVTHWAISLAHGSQVLIPIYSRQMIILLKIKISGTWKNLSLLPLNVYLLLPSGPGYSLFSPLLLVLCLGHCYLYIVHASILSFITLTYI